MKNNSTFKAAALALGLLLGGCAKNGDVDPTITNLVVSTSDFQLLEDAAVRGNVAELLGSRNPNDASGKYTVFAPTNAAFNRLGVRSALDLTAIRQPFLRTTLFFHVANGAIAGSNFTPGSASASALALTRRIIKRADGNLYVNGSRILGTDVRAANGLVHPIDKVLLATGGNVVESALALSKGEVFVAPELTFLVAAVVKCNLVSLLSAPGPYTVFAPTDQAFKDAGFPTIESINNANVATLTSILANHVLINNSAAQLGGKFTTELPEKTSVTAFGGGRPLQLGAFTNGLMTVQGGGSAQPSNMLIPDVQCTNGVVHVIDRVLKP